MWMWGWLVACLWMFTLWYTVRGLFCLSPNICWIGSALYNGWTWIKRGIIQHTQTFVWLKENSNIDSFTILYYIIWNKILCYVIFYIKIFNSSTHHKKKGRSENSYCKREKYLFHAFPVNCTCDKKERGKFITIPYNSPYKFMKLIIFSSVYIYNMLISHII